MKKTAYFLITFIFMGFALIAQNPADKSSSLKQERMVENTPEEEVVAELGIESIVPNKDGSVTISIYLLSEQPVAGFQMDFLPEDVIKPGKIYGGISEELGFMMKAAENGRVLGFSMQGKTIPVAASGDPSENILYRVTARINGKKGDKITIDFSPVIAGVGGIKLKAQTVPFTWKIK